jgi:hypothetical protein
MGKKFTKALTPTQAEEMRTFLQTLLRLGEQAKEAGTKPDIELFMKSWRGLPIGEEGKADRQRERQRLYDAGRRAKRREENVSTKNKLRQRTL